MIRCKHSCTYKEIHFLKPVWQRDHACIRNEIVHPLRIAVSDGMKRWHRQLHILRHDLPYINK